MLSPLAHAKPADPSWIEGYWDDADFDEIIQFLAASCPAILSVPPIFETIRAPVVGLVPSSGEGSALVLFRSSFTTRAPPA